MPCDEVALASPRVAGVKHTLRWNNTSMQLEARSFEPNGRVVQNSDVVNEVLLSLAVVRENYQRHWSTLRWDDGVLLQQQILGVIEKAAKSGVSITGWALGDMLSALQYFEKTEFPVGQPWNSPVEPIHAAVIVGQTEWSAPFTQHVNWVLCTHGFSSVTLYSSTGVGCCDGCMVLDLTKIDPLTCPDRFRHVVKLLVPCHSVLVVDGLGSPICRVQTKVFMECFAKHLKPLYKPAGTYTVTFECVTVTADASGTESLVAADLDALSFRPAKSTLKFVESPSWDHHHNNAFTSAVSALKTRFHNPHGSVLFIPAVEEFLCDDEMCTLETKKWVGIIHNIVDMPQYKYVPDMRRLCRSERYAKAMDNCLGLFTLTSFQAKYLRANLKQKLPITRLFCPAVSISSGDKTILSARDSAAAKLIDGRLVQIGGFERDLPWFYSVAVPIGVRKVLLLGEDTSSVLLTSQVEVCARLNAVDYETVLSSSVVVLPLKADGAANTILLECIHRSVPIIVPDFEAVLEYLGADYPLVFKRDCMDISHLLTVDMLTQAISYLRDMDKSRFTLDAFCNSVENSVVYCNLPPTPSASNVGPGFGDSSLQGESELTSTFDVTISICSYRRTQHLDTILKRLWNEQDYKGRVEIVVWNNNSSREKVVAQICAPFIASSNRHLSLRLIQSSTNYYCSIRLAMAPLMRSPELLVCDDDVLPGPHFISFFMAGRVRHPKAFLCIRGHVFSPHELDCANATDIWTEYEYVRFVDDERAEQAIHFVHADACLISQKALRLAASVEMEDSTFNLVDDYHMSYALSAKFNVPLIKLSTAGLHGDVVERTEDSDDSAVALHKRPEVCRARMRLYIHHMLRQWPFGPKNVFGPTAFDPSLHILQAGQGDNVVKNKSVGFHKLFGVNCEENLSQQDVAAMAEMGVKVARIGIVGTGTDSITGNVGLLNSAMCPLMLTPLMRSIDMLASYEIDVIITLSPAVATVDLWRTIAIVCGSRPNVVGYDLLNEPHSAWDDSGTVGDLAVVKTAEDWKGVEELTDNYESFVHAVRQVDATTPFIFESAYWAHSDTLRPLLISLRDRGLLKSEPNCLVSFHFYSPRMLTSFKNQQRYKYPGTVPDFAYKHCESRHWDKAALDVIFDNAKTVCAEFGLPPERVIVGEFGIQREVEGADKYLCDVVQTCAERGMSCVMYAFREKSWSAMNYELGGNVTNTVMLTADRNPLLAKVTKTVLECYVVSDNQIPVDNTDSPSGERKSV